MNDEAADKYINQHKRLIVESVVYAPVELRKALRTLIKEVERDTRHKCAEAAASHPEIHGKIMNLRH